ncbi:MULTISPECIES: hypothetical protein [Bacillus amyloliquefaciens group]|uniref:hypothetical protein n=1 Tax=Bacillus amyloliquefaciens group TaxID=1938374 RepID=UPI000241640E|nr:MULTISPECIES: hypothetical protein [Bacillus amyloliquefaciens group]AGF26885.1 hypothetical protein KSO_006940 [Bacillus amyloliquefaciens IT-45]ERK83403.1 hypothetical protein N786_09015 [Bacillus amyloliquefaciens UASWS BA1]MDQ1917337.1 hypothetical protein [Bacillus velezensis]
MKEFKINLSKGEVLYTGSYICTLSKTAASAPEQISLEAAVEKLAEELIMQQAMNRENQRQQEIAVNQFRQAQAEIQRLTKENDRFRKAFHLFANMKTVRTAPELVIQSYSRYAKDLLEGRGLEGDAE